MKTDCQLAILEAAYENGMTRRRNDCPKILQCSLDSNLSIGEIEVSIMLA